MLEIPHFARLNDYFGVWLMEPRAANGLYQLCRGIDLAAHVREGIANPPQVRSPLRPQPRSGKPQVAVVEVVGTMMKGQSSMGGTSTVAARRAVRAAAADPLVCGILLAIDSPGGSSAGTADLAADVRAAARQKPVYAQIEDTAASAAYWVASQADQVFANSPTALVGNVGTYMVVEDTTAANEKAGVREVAFSSGPLKVFGGGLGVSEAQGQMLQGVVDAIQAEFTAAVRSGRGLSESNLSQVLSGAIYPAAQAQALGLIDGIQSMDATIAMLAKNK